MLELTSRYATHLDVKYGPADAVNFPSQEFTSKAWAMFHVGYMDLEPWQRAAYRAYYILGIADRDLAAATRS